MIDEAINSTPYAVDGLSLLSLCGTFTFVVGIIMGVVELIRSRCVFNRDSLRVSAWVSVMNLFGRCCDVILHVYLCIIQ